jgi:xylulokinase
MWLRRFEPAAFQAIKWLAQPMDYIAYRLCGNLVAAVASLKIVPWQEDEISESGLNPSLFPPFAVMGSSIGSLTERALLETNLRRGTRVFAGAPDFVEAILATSSQEAGIVCDKAGSSEGLELCSAVPLKTGFYTALHPISDGMHHIGASISTTGLTIEWLCSLTGRTAQQLAKMAEDVPLGSSGLRFYPHLAAERSFLFGSRPEGLISGLRLHHGAPELARCMMEGCSNAVALVITEYRSAGAEISEIRVTGGQSRSMLWNQMKSDMTGLDVVVPAVPDGEMLGAAMIAAAGSGVAEGLQQASRMMAVQAGRIHPIKENSEAYRAVFQARSSN